MLAKKNGKRTLVEIRRLLDRLHEMNERRRLGTRRINARAEMKKELLEDEDGEDSPVVADPADPA